MYSYSHLCLAETNLGLFLVVFHLTLFLRKCCYFLAANFVFFSVLFNLSAIEKKSVGECGGIENYFGIYLSYCKKSKTYIIFGSTPANIYLFKVKNRNTRKRSEICSKLTIKSTERRQRRRFYCYFTPFSSVSIIDFEQVNVSWEFFSQSQFKQNCIG